MCPRLGAHRQEIVVTFDKTKIMHEGKERDGLEIPVEETVVRETIVKLADGTKVKVINLLQRAVRIQGEFNSNGDPVYVMDFQSKIDVTVADDLKGGTSSDD